MTEGKIRPLGELEQTIMNALWQEHPATVKQVAAALPGRQLAYTTIMTTLDRLFKKQLVEREKISHSFTYRPAMDRVAFERKLVASLLGELSHGSREALLSGFLDATGNDDETLDALERLVMERKRLGGAG